MGVPFWMQLVYPIHLRKETEESVPYPAGEMEHNEPLDAAFLTRQFKTV